MAENNTTFELRSEEIQDILSRVPHWMIRWGTLLIFTIIAMLVFVSWFVKYPDVIATPIVITTSVPPEKLVARTSGRIETILVNDKAAVSENTPLAVIANTAKFKDVFVLQSILDTLDINKKIKFPFELLRDAELGDIENAYSVFQKDYVANELNSNLHPFQVENNAQHSEKIQIKTRLTLLQQQKNLNESELQLQKNDLKRFETLLSKGVISEQDFELKKLAFLQAQKNYKSLLSSISQLQSSLIDNNRNSSSTRINETKEKINLDRNLIQSFYQLKKTVKDWELNYVLKSSIEGQVSFLQIWTANQTISASDNVFSIIPTTKKGFIGKVKAPAQNSGKIKVGQQVNIRLANFPDREFGMLKGKVKNISLVPDKEGNLLIDVALPQDLKTNYNKFIPFQQEMTGSAEIVTEDLRLLERVLYQFRSIVKAN
ncbi:HlyD family secretion protein [Flavobacterium sp. GT3R68]|uniref:HlyD family secretion protein n=1 Tax=Flavobacterium sp. GT3R68 TaxID=2594437 RepID=UPI000F8674CB|nr:HlyD family efflux transporter periplasmic adaptor subunit [Flavobacterium sp. GT3R68]RTY91371.1 HlyD family efflux transporter periplasmic adaptor subunit [Flavobacterium sp. GSN2]TRW93997.1 HlyD family efflux transporter periplasmic adaptor subunit [Flavobacterium sp. GT3R68]